MTDETDETEVGIGPEESTAIHEPARAADAGGFAWSEARDLPDLSSRSRLPVLVFVVAVAALVAAAGGWWFAAHNHTSTAPARPASPVSSTASAGASPVAPGNSDQFFLGQLSALGIGVPDQVYAIQGGHWVCSVVVGGNGNLVVADLMKRFPNFTAVMARGYATAAVSAYCPQYGGQI